MLKQLEQMNGMTIQEKVEFLMDALPAPEITCKSIGERIGESADLVALYMLCILNNRADARNKPEARS